MEIINIALVITSLITACLSLFIVKGKNTSQNKVFSLFILSISLWAFGILFFRISSSLDVSLIFANFNYIIAATIPVFFLHFSYLFPIEQKLNSFEKITIYIPFIIVLVGLIIEPHLILKEVYLSNNNIKLASVNSISYWIYASYFIIYVLIAYINLFKSFLSTKDQNIKMQLKFIFAGTILPYILATYFDLILPPFDYSLTWIGPLLGLVVTCVLVYAIYKHHLLNTKIIAAEFFTISLWVFILIRILLAKTEQEIIINIVLLILTIIFGILLVLSVLLESRQKEELRKLNAKLKDLNENLEQKVMEQVGDVKRAFVLEQKAKVELEKLNETKDQFIMITQHSLRTPLTAIRWELESMLNGSHGEISKDIKNTLIDTTTATDRLARIIDDFLNITALKVGTQILNISIGNIKTLLEKVLKELKVDIEKLNISIDYPKDEKSWPNMKMDINKMKEVILIIIENAVRYNIQNGNITIKTNIKINENNLNNNLENNKKDIKKYNETNDKHVIFEITIKDTGVGITNEDKGNIFKRLFYRGKKAQVTHPIGMGIGLSVARAIARAHHGDIIIRSEGENMGAEITISLPFVFLGDYN